MQQGKLKDKYKEDSEVNIPDLPGMNFTIYYLLVTLFIRNITPSSTKSKPLNRSDFGNILTRFEIELASAHHLCFTALTEQDDVPINVILV